MRYNKKAETENRFPAPNAVKGEVRIANVFLAASKAVIGLMTHSIAVVPDAVNNFSDAGSSLITIIGTKLAGVFGRLTGNRMLQPFSLC